MTRTADGQIRILMASGGTGDVLAGVIAGLRAQGLAHNLPP